MIHKYDNIRQPIEKPEFTFNFGNCVKGYNTVSDNLLVLIFLFLFFIAIIINILCDTPKPWKREQKYRNNSLSNA